jgi:hypothetical protein
MKEDLIERKTLERIRSILREEGFSDVQVHPSTSAWTLSAEKGALRLVVHLNDQTAPILPRSGLALSRTAERFSTAAHPGSVSEAGKPSFAGNSGGASRS